MSVQYVVFAPQAPLSRARWQYYQHVDGSIARSISGPKFGESKPGALDATSVFPDAMAWARCLHSGKSQFEDSGEASEVYATLCNVVFNLGRGDALTARICLDGIIEDCQEWKRRLKEGEHG